MPLALTREFLSDLFGVFAQQWSSGMVTPRSFVLLPRMPWIEETAAKLGMLNFNEILTRDALRIIEQLFGIPNRPAGDAATL